MTTMTLPMFPLELVVFPREQLALHIFEDRYRQLIQDCENEEITFGIPTYIDKRLEYGTEVGLEKVVKRYPSGAFDILCKGLRVFKINDFYKTLDNKLYSGGSVSIIMERPERPSLSKSTFIQLLAQFYKELKMDTPEIKETQINSFTLSHKVGLSLEEEYKFLQIRSETKRYQFLIDHLNILIPTVKKINRTKELIKLNGHFKNLDPLDFEE